MIGLNIEMPKSCSECPCQYDYIYCQADTKLKMYCDESFDFLEQRHPKCPLVEIPMPEEMNVRICGSGWVYCNGNCAECPKANINTTNHS